MKNALIICSLLIGFSIFAQRPQGNNDRPPRPHMDRPDYSPEQIAELQTKKLTLLLDLTESQQTKIKSLELEMAKERELKLSQREAGKKPSDEERFNNHSEMLDKQISHKKSMNAILTKDQFEKWEKSLLMKSKKRHHEGHRGMKSEKRH
jgi:hypothetical protein